MNTEAMYAGMKPWRLFFVVALPGMVSMFAMSVYSIAEGIFIGQLLGETAFAAINIAFPLVMINFSMADLIGVGASVPISISLGKKEYDNANNIFTCAIILIFAVSFAMGVLMYAAAEPLAKMMGADETLLATSVRYLRTYALLSPFTAIFFAMDNCLRISGYVKTSMGINIFCNLLTIGLLALFLMVLDFDVVGSALAACIAMCVSAIFALIPFVQNRALLKFTRPRFNTAMIKQIAACGSPSFLSNISGRVTAILMNITLMTLGVKAFGAGGGPTAVAVYAVLMYSSDLCWPLLYGISDSLAPAIGYNWGAENYDRVKKIVKCGYLGTTVIGVLSTAILFFFPGMVASMFASAEDARLLAEATHAIRLFCLAYLFRWFVVVSQGFLSAIEKPKFATIMSVSTAMVFPVLLIALLWPFGLDGIWLNFAGVNILAAALAVVLLRRVQKEIRLREKQKTQAE